ncbi:MAG: tRNA (N6-threonylcarbamoyladenosine(37)-N6)-methyltransferase TrmO [Nitrospirota bacterium]
MKPVAYEPIGTIYTPFRDLHDMPIQTKGGIGVKGRIIIKPSFTQGLRDITGFSHIILIYHFHHSKKCDLLVKPFLDDTEHGVFATRAPKRPNPIGISVVRLRRVEGRVLHIENVDIMNRTPLLDIKPYIPAIDAFRTKRIGWLARKTKRFGQAKSDRRFQPSPRET